MDLSRVEDKQAKQALKGLMDMISQADREDVFIAIKTYKESKDESLWFIGEYIERGMAAADAISVVNEEADDE